MNIKNLITGKGGLFSIRRLFVIGTTILTSKIVLILIAYFFSEVQYNTFNQAYYTASILIIFGAFGFGYAVNKVNIHFILVTLAAVINVVITFYVLLVFSPPGFNIFQTISVIVYALFAVLGGIFSFQVLFQGYYSTYFYLITLNGILHIALIPVITVFHIDIYMVLPFVTFLWFTLGFPKFIKGKSFRFDSVKELYQIGSANFVINSVVPLVLVADKYYVNHYFGLETANAYTFSWALIAPMFYIGNLIEKVIYSSLFEKGEKVLKKSLLVLTVLIIIYTGALLYVLYYIPSILPGSVNVILMRKIFTFMAAGYSVYVIFHFPINGYLFKFKEIARQKTIAVVFAVFIAVWTPFYLFFLKQFYVENFKIMLITIWIFIFSLLILKSLIMFTKREPVIAAGKQE